MPGLVAIISKMPRQRAAAQLTEMLNALYHAPFHTAGAWSDPEAGVYVGWVSRKGEFSEQMPLRNESGDATLVFSGEDFAAPGTIDRLKAKGHQIEGSSASYLIHSYEEDAEFPANLNGKFHGIVFDALKKQGILFNDRYGMHRLYVHQSEDAFYFAAEAKAILRVCPELRQLDYRSLGEFISCGAVLENRTIFEGIAVLPQGSAWVFGDGAIQKKTSYFDPAEWEKQETLDTEAYYRELHSAFTGNLGRYFSGPEAIGMSLTGGLDTRMILANHRAAPNSTPCYTFGSVYRENHDVRVARKVAEAWGQSFQVLTAGEEFLAHFPRYAEQSIFLTDGCVDASRAPDLYLNEMAREIAPARMTGLYGGELLRGFRAFKPNDPGAPLYSADFKKNIDATRATYARLVAAHPTTFSAFYQGPWFLRGSLSLEQTQLSMLTPFLDNAFVKAVYRSPKSAFLDSRICLRLIADGNRALAAIPTDRGLRGDRDSFSDALSTKMLNFTFKAEYAYDMGMPQWLAQIDHAFSAFHFEKLFLGRHKTFHFRTWYRDQLSDYVREILLDQQTLARPCFERKTLEAVVQGHTRGEQNFTNEIHKALTLELVHRVFFQQHEPTGQAKEPVKEAVLVGAGSK